MYLLHLQCYNQRLQNFDCGQVFVALNVLSDLPAFCLLKRLSSVSTDTAEHLMAWSILRSTLSVVVVQFQILVADRPYLSSWGALMAALIYCSGLSYVVVALRTFPTMLSSYMYF